MEFSFLVFLLLAFAGSGSAYSIRPHIAASYCELELKKLDICKKLYFMDLRKFTNDTDLDEAVSIYNGFTVCLGDDDQCTVTQLTWKLYKAEFRLIHRKSQMYQCFTHPHFKELIKSSCPGACADCWNCVIDGLKKADICSNDEIRILYDDLEQGLLTDPCKFRKDLRYETGVHYERLRMGL
ncbi:unnamed protein product [Caenorhabditis nigoni]